MEQTDEALRKALEDHYKFDLGYVKALPQS